MSDARTVHVGAVVVRNGEALFVRQTPTHSLGPVWTIPWGLLHAGEAPSAAALRETLEEAGIVANATGLLAAQSLPAPWEGTIALVFLCTHEAGEPRPDGVETDAARYLSLEELIHSDEPFEPWCRWLTIRALQGHDAALHTNEDNPFGTEGFVA
jgi:ADP-ribose pyrophosphatase YjhB (NUDIX family)